MKRPRLTLSLLAMIAAVLLVAPAAHAASAHRAAAKNAPLYPAQMPAGAEELTYKFGPMKIKPGQNMIDIDIQQQRPNVDGWIVAFKPGLVYAKDGKSPSVNVVHLHHAVWLVDMKPVFAAGEEKTNFFTPPGYGWRYTTKQTWMLNHMIHDLVGQSHEVYLTYTLWFIPDTAPEAANIKRIDTQWMDVEGIKPYPVFDALKGSGTKGKFEYPDQAKNPYPDGKVRNKWTVDRDATLVATAGHLHPGGLWTDLKLTRDGKTVRIFRSKANYFEPTGPVSWDVAMTATSKDWRVAVKKGDVLSVTATYDTTRASWYEVMGIMVVGMTQKPDGGVDPFTEQVDQTGYLTHGRLPENIDKGVGGKNPGLRNPLRLRSGPFRDKVTIRNFVYQQGDLSMPGRKGLPPRIRQGRQLTFVNQDTPLGVRFHTITACKAPCNRTGGIRYPLAGGPGLFDSGELGFGPTINLAGMMPGGDNAIPITAAVPKPTKMDNCRGTKYGGPSGLVNLIKSGCVGTKTWKTPKNLKVGTYAYFCRIHPFMRGAFKVVPKAKKK